MEYWSATKMTQIQNMLYDSLINTKHVDRAALIKIREMTAITSPPSFKMETRQVFILISAFTNAPAIRSEGLNFMGKNYKCVRADKNSVYAKCDGDGIVLIKTKHHILLATYREGMYPSVCVEAAETLGAYFRGKEN